MRAAVAAALLALAACAPTAPAEDAAAPAGSWLLPGTDWRLVELAGAAVVPSVTATLTEDGRIVGQAPCNRFTAAWSGRWPDLAFAPVAATRMACPDLPAETAFFDALGRVDRATMGDGGLTLTGPDGVRLGFERI